MSRQAKTAKKVKKAAADAIEIVSQAVSTVSTKRKQGCTDEDWAVACQVRDLRDAGTAWWAIAQTLGLPGAGTSASTGKAGAAQARKAYAKGFGSHPRSFTRGQGRTRREKNEHVKAINQSSKRDRVALVRSGKAAIDPDIPSAELAAMLKGRKVQWMIIGDIAPLGLEQEAWVHPSAPIYIEGEGADRIIEFREQHRRAPVDVRWMPAHIRTVRLSRIHSIKGER